MKLTRRITLSQAGYRSTQQQKVNPLREIQNSHPKQISKPVRFLSPSPPPSSEQRKQHRRPKKVPCTEESLLQRAGLHRKRGRRVRFDFRGSYCYDNTQPALTAHRIQKLWYSKDEIRQFQQDTREWYAQEPGMSSAVFGKWSQTLQAVYDAFCTNNDPQEILALLETAHVFHLTGLGMERRAVGLVCDDALKRRHQIYAHVLRCQTAPIPDPWMRGQMMREMSRTLSKPSRLYARHIAHMTAVADVDQDGAWYM